MQSSQPLGSEPVGLNVPALGSYSSAEVRALPVPSSSPVTRTRPSLSSVAAELQRPVDIEPVGLNLPVAGS